MWFSPRDRRRNRSLASRGTEGQRVSTTATGIHYFRFQRITREGTYGSCSRQKENAVYIGVGTLILIIILILILT